MMVGSYSGGSVKCTSIIFCIYVQSERERERVGQSGIFYGICVCT